MSGSWATQLGRAVDVLAFLDLQETFQVQTLADAMECSRRHAYRVLRVLEVRDLVEHQGTNLWVSRRYRGED